MNYSGKHIWVTGASSGIGQAVAVELSKEKAHLILSGRNESSLKETADLCKLNGSSALIVPFDLAYEDSIVSAAKNVLSKGITPDCLYHFGGISQRSLAYETPLNVDRKIFEVNFFGTIALTKAILPAMINKGDGHIAVTSSVVGKFGFPYRSAYAASKHALHGFFESLRAESSNKNIRVSIIVPGRIRTAISVNAINSHGTAHGKMDQGLARGMTAEKSARIIVRKLKKEHKEILVGGKEILMVHIRRFVPALYYFLSSKLKPL
jgi:dehydrogenase/reductase SDR family member 7B